MAISQATVRNDQLELQRRGFINVNLTALTTTAVPDVIVGSAFEVGGSIYEVDTADETPSGWSGIANDNQVYIKFDASAESLVFTTTAPSYSSAKGGWYSGDDRYIAKVYKNASGEAVNKEVYRGDSESGDALRLYLDSLPRFRSRATFTTSGNHTWVCPEKTFVVKAAIVGGGGGGGGARSRNQNGTRYAAGAGGGSGAVAIAEIAVTPGKEYTFTVGAGGSGGTGDSNGADGGDSTAFSITASGGGGGGYSRHVDTSSGLSNVSGTGGSGGSDPDDGYSGAGDSGGNGNYNNGTVVSSGEGGTLPDLRAHPVKYSEFQVNGGASVDSPTSPGTTVAGNDGDDGCGGSGGAALGDNDHVYATGGDGGDGFVIVAY
jgi:hypothetical protein